MNGIEYLLDTNFILGMLKGSPEVVAQVSGLNLAAAQCAYSAVTRMELLGFPGITDAEDALIRSRLQFLQCLDIDAAVQDKAIALRGTRKIKLPDALIAATALCHGLQLLTLDVGLQTVVRDIAGTSGTSLSSS